MPKQQADIRMAWDRAREAIRPHVGDAAWETYLENLELESTTRRNGSAARVVFKTPTGRRWIKERFGQLIQSALQDELGCDIDVEIKDTDKKDKPRQVRSLDVARHNAGAAQTPTSQTVTTGQSVARKRTLKVNRRTAESTHYIPRPFARRPAIFTGASSGKDLHGEFELSGRLKPIDQATIGMLRDRYIASGKKSIQISVSEATEYLKQRYNYGGVDARSAEGSLRRLLETRIDAPSSSEYTSFVGHVIGDVKRRVDDKVWALDDLRDKTEDLSRQDQGRMFGPCDSGTFEIELTEAFLRACEHTPVKVDAAAHTVLGKASPTYTWLLGESAVRNKGGRYRLRAEVMAHLGQQGSPTRSKIKKVCEELDRIQQIDDRLKFTVINAGTKIYLHLQVTSVAIGSYETYTPVRKTYIRVSLDGSRVIYQPRGDP